MCERCLYAGCDTSDSSLAASVLLDEAPISWSATVPSLKKSSVGIERTLYCIAICGLLSTSSFAIFARPANSDASSSIMGAIIRHGPHHAAQKSTRTGSSALMTSFTKLLSVTVTGFAISYLVNSVFQMFKNETAAGRPQSICYNKYAEILVSARGIVSACLPDSWHDVSASLYGGRKEFG